MSQDVCLKEKERVDDLQNSGLRIIQNPVEFCFGMDAVLLASFVQIRAGGQAVDLCTGSGIIPLLLSARTEAAASRASRSSPRLRTWPGAPSPLTAWTGSSPSIRWTSRRPPPAWAGTLQTA